VRITTELALKWARLPVRAHPHRWRQRLRIARGFARYVATLDPASEVPSEDLLRAHRPRVAPYIYSPAEITALMQAAGGWAPLHPTATKALRDYARLRDRHWQAPPSPAFLLNLRGQRLRKSEFNHWFAELIRQVGLEGAGERVRPRPHDLRHTMAVRTLLDWHHAGEDIDRRMPELSTFLGHLDPESTYWYLQAVPELMALISARLQRLEEVLP
jgi:integrase/recombinase XerD